MSHHSRVIIAIPMAMMNVILYTCSWTHTGEWIHYGPLAVRGPSQGMSEIDEAVDTANAAGTSSDPDRREACHRATRGGV